MPLDRGARFAATQNTVPPLRKGTLMTSTAIIYQRPKNAMQSGRALTDRWVLEFKPEQAKKPDPFTGWAGGADTKEQLRLSFPDCDAAKAYADKYGIPYRLVETPKKTLKLQAYADNFR